VKKPSVRVHDNSKTPVVKGQPSRITWRTEKRKLSALKKWARNPRQATEIQTKDLEKSLDRFNLADPLIINTDNTIIGGHFRYDLLIKKFGKDKIVDVRVPDHKLNPKQVEELNLRLNKNLGEWNFDLLGAFTEDLLKEVGFSTDELDQVFGLAIDDSFEVQKELERVLKHGPKRVKSGDVWQLGEHKLIIGDCTQAATWQRLLINETFDFMFTDPPYKLAYSKKRVRKIRTKTGAKLKRQRIYTQVGETDIQGKPKREKPAKGFGYKGTRTYLGVEKMGGVPEYDEWLSIASNFQNVKGANVMIFENWRNTVALWQAVEKYWKIRNMVIWHLPNRHQGFSRPFMFYNKYDIAVVADKGKSPINEYYETELDNYLKEKGQKLLDNYEIAIFGNSGESTWSKVKGTKWARLNDHITWVAESESSSGQNVVFGTKPVQILVPYVKILSPRDGILMEPYAGSGSTIIACEIMKRKCRAIEIEPIYAEVILARWEKFTGLKAKRTSK
jgi:DNA modification methylase